MKNRAVIWPLLLVILVVVFARALPTGATTGAIYSNYFPIIGAPSNLVFADDFSDSGSGWPTGDDGLISRSYKDGEYETLIYDAKWWAGSKAPVYVQYDNYSVEADMRRHEGSTSDYGLVFDQVDWVNFYFFAMDPGSRRYFVAKVENGTPLIIVPWTDATTINPDNQVNHLKVERIGTELAVYANGHHLTTATNSGFGGVSGIGLYMESDADAPASVRYDNFEAWRLETGQVQTAMEGLTITESVGTGGGSCEATSDWCNDG